MFQTIALREKAPVVYGMYGRYFAPPPPTLEDYRPPQRQSRNGWWGGLGGGAFALLSLFRLLAGGMSSSSSDSMSRTEWKSTPYVAPNLGAGNGTNRSTTTQDRATAKGARTWDSRWSDTSQPSAPGSVVASSSAAPALSGGAASVEQAIAAKNCEGARRALADLRASRTVGKSPVSDALVARVDGLCKGTK
jgi:hypothetical protein